MVLSFENCNFKDTSLQNVKNSGYLKNAVTPYKPPFVTNRYVMNYMKTRYKSFYKLRATYVFVSQQL